MKIKFAPRTRTGKWSAASLLAFFLFFSLLNLLIALGERGGETFFSNLLLAIPGLLAAISGIAAFITGTISIFRNKERSILVFAAVIIGFFIFLFVLSELIFPH